jgi:hypothetical protein
VTTATFLFLLVAFGLGIIVGAGLGIIVAFTRIGWLERLGLVEPEDKSNEPGMPPEHPWCRSFLPPDDEPLDKE